MAKLKGPLFSLGASQQIGKALVYFPWKGLNVVREYVIPANPKSEAQNIQRGYLRDIVTIIHNSQATTNRPINATDIIAFALWAGVVQVATTWFNQVVRSYLDQMVACKSFTLYKDGTIWHPASGEIGLNCHCVVTIPDNATLFYGTSRTALVHTVAGTQIIDVWHATATGLTKGVKYYFQMRSDAGDATEGSRSGIYHAVAT